MLVILFVDDAQGYLHCVVEDINQAIQRANQDSAALVQWSGNAGIALNPDKVQAMIIGSRHNLRKLDAMVLCPLVVDGVIVPLTDCVTSLGLKISNDLRWHRHVSDIVASSNRILYFMNSRARYLPVKIKKLLASQLLFPKLDYACITMIGLTGDLQGRLERQLNKAVRFVFNLPRRAGTSEFRSKLHWLTIYQRRQYFLLTLTYKVLETRTPPYLYDMLSPRVIDYSLERSIQTRHRPFFAIPTRTTRTLDSSFALAAMVAWNSISEETRNAENINKFKVAVKKVLSCA